jgi:hypothetical protein
MFLGFGILAAAFTAAVQAVLVVHAGWSRSVASLAALAVCPLLWVAYVHSIEDSIEGGLALMIGLPIAILAGVAGVGIAIIGEAVHGAGDRDDGRD